MSRRSEEEAWDRDIARFREKVSWSGEHWIWVGGRGGTGYGSFRMGEQSLTAHGAAWRLGGNELIDGTRLRRDCGVIGCARPSHWRDHLNRPGFDPW